MDHFIGVLFIGFWVVFCAAIVIRLVLALRRRRPGDSLRDSVLRPVLGAAALGSVFSGLDRRSSERVAETHRDAQDPGISLEEPWPERDRSARPAQSPDRASNQSVEDSPE
ncbi:hypothetical protein [Nesterenkonia lutea]|uniref:DUF4229 domain-containing protein n=1 Tax=Nesterenkonia lutea TaxID=272919 RepID=A0ABR9JER1_9MICC|nr:hypothetical protein [Nesterenkonia lutea]MBE1524416.1 hypothetical protein [Nesterenkonia lutea]